MQWRRQREPFLGVFGDAIQPDLLRRADGRSARGQRRRGMKVTARGEGGVGKVINRRCCEDDVVWGEAVAEEFKVYGNTS